MKIRAGFVSNSSSTSFLIIAKGDLNKVDFFELMGIDLNSPVAGLFEQLYRDVLANSKKVDFKLAGKSARPELLVSDRPERLSSHMRSKLLDAQRRGWKAYYGWLDSESNPVQTFFCMDSFEVENEKIYFNGLECVW